MGVVNKSGDCWGEVDDSRVSGLVERGVVGISCLGGLSLGGYNSGGTFLGLC